MNKKRIALALAAGLSLNAFVVTVGQVGGQTQIAHAQESRVLPGTENQTKVNAIDIKTLNTTVSSYTTDGTLNLNINKENVKTVDGTLSFTKFDERKNSTDSNSSVTATWNSTSKTVEIKNVKGAGIYSGDLKITYNDNTTETYKLTFRKTYEDEKLTIEGVDVLPSGIKFTNLKLGSTPVSLGQNEKIELKLGNDIVGTITDINKDKFFEIGQNKLKEGQVYDVVYLGAGGEKDVKGRTQILITKAKTVTVDGFATNGTGFSYVNKLSLPANLEAKIKSYYGDSVTATLSVVDEANGKYQIEVKDGAKVIDTIPFDQDVYDKRKPYGGELKLTSTSDGNLTVGLGTIKAGDTNFVPSFKLTGGKDAKTPDTLVGQYTVSIDGNTQTYLDASSGVTATPKVGNGNKAYLDITNGTLASDPNLVFPKNETFSTTLSNFSHGYKSVAVTFDVYKDGEIIGGKTLESLQAELDALKNDNSVTSSDTLAVSPVNTPVSGNKTKVNTSILVFKDELDGVSLSANFSKNSDKEGTFTLVDGQKLVDGGATLQEIATALTVSNNGKNGNVIYSNTVGNNLEFKVTFADPISGNINWNYKGLNGTVELVAVETLNFDGQVTTSNVDAEKLENDFYVQAKLSSIIPSTSTATIEVNKKPINFTNGRALVNVKDFVSGSYEVKAVVSSSDSKKYQGTYTANLIVNAQPMGLRVNATSTTNNRIDATVDASFFKKEDVSNVQNAKLIYTKVGDSSAKPVELTIAKDQIKEDPISFNLTVDAGKYDVKAVYEYKDASGKITQVVSNTVQVDVKGNSNTGSGNNNGSGIVSGGSGSTTTPGNSAGSTTITSTSSNTTSDFDTVNITLPSGIVYDSGKTPVPVRFTYKDKDGKTVTETKEQYSNVTARFENGKIVVDGVVPGKDYIEISIDYTDNSGRTRTLVLRDVKTSYTNELDKYLANVYTAIFMRPADESGYHFHLKNLGDKKTSLREFLLNLLGEKEFGDNYKTSESKVDGLYAAIVARTPDKAGRDFWVSEYNKAVKTYGSEALALKAIADRMVNEPELKALAEKMNVQW